MLCKLIGIKIPAEEFTLSRYASESGVGFVALQMILDFDRCGSTPLLKPDVTRCGVSNMPSPITDNLIQCLYVLMPMQPPTEESIK
jgi:hypothetical protein